MVVDRSAIKRWFAERTTTCDGSDVTETWRVIHNGADVLADAVALGTFQVLVLGHDAESFLTDQALGHVRNWVASDSGALVCYRGQPPEKSGTHTVFDVRRLLEEQLDLKARPDLMARIAASTGGVELKTGVPSELADAFTAHLDRSRPERIRRIAAWDRWWVLLGTFFIWTLACGVRRRAGLV